MFLGVAESFSVAVRQRSRRASIFSIASPRLLAVYTRTLQASCIIGVLTSYQPWNPFHDGADCQGSCEGSGMSKRGPVYALRGEPRHGIDNAKSLAAKYLHKALGVLLQTSRTPWAQR